MEKNEKNTKNIVRSISYNQTFIFYDHRMSIVVGKETIVKDEDLKGWLNRITGLEEENKKLKSDLSLVIKERDDNIKQNKKLSEKNGQLKSDLAFKNTMLDNVSAEYESSLNIIRKQNKRIKELEQCNLNLQTWIDNKEKVNKSLREENERLSDFLECEA